MGCHDAEQGASKYDAQRARILARENHFNCEDTPARSALIQKRTRGPMGSHDAEQDASKYDAQRARILARENHFNREDALAQSALFQKRTRGPMDGDGEEYEHASVLTTFDELSAYNS